MAELIISLSGWLLITSVFVPFYMQLQRQLVQLEEKSEALHLFYEYMQKVVVENPERENAVITNGDKQFTIVWHGADKKAVMITYEDVFGRTIEIHETTP